jgi:hypothetical protein
MAFSPARVLLEGKHPGEVLDYTANFAAWLPSGDTLATLVSCTASAGITVASSPAPAIVGATVVFWLSGGTSGSTYTIEVKVTTTAGRTLVADLEITVTDPTP